MADQAASTVAGTVISGLADRALATAMRKLHAPASAHDKLLRLEMLVLKEVAAEGGEVLLHFQRRAREDGDGDGDAAPASSAADDRQQSAGGALYFTRSSLHAMAQRVRDAARRLFSTDEDMKKLDTSLKRMELVSPDITQFVTLLQHEVSRKLSRRPAKRRAPPSPPRDVANFDFCQLWDWEVLPPDSKQMPTETSSRKAVVELEEDMPVAPAEAEDRENEAAISVFLQALRLVETRGVKATEDRDVEGLEWLAQWAAVLREAVERGADVRQTLGGVSREAGLGADIDELQSFARLVDWLSSEVDCFSILASLCPWKQWDFR